jgi:hypothetical protein
MTRILGAMLVAVMTGCAGGAPCEGASCVFEPGDRADPIFRQAQAVTGSESVTLTFANKSGYGFSQGLVLFTVPFTVGTAPHVGLFNFVRSSSASAGKADVLAAGLGLTVGTNAFLVPRVANGANATVSLTVPAGTRITYVARVENSIDDFITAADVPLSSGVPGQPIAFAIQGYDLSTNNNPNGLTTLGNGTTGANPASTSLTITTSGDCPAGPTVVAQNWLNDDFSAGALDSAWPRNAGWDGDFNGDWYTDGQTARVWNPNWGGASPTAPVPTTTGFWKFFDVCPAAGAKLSVESKVTTNFSDARSDSTLVVYFFDRGGQLLSVSTNHPLRDTNDRIFALYDAEIPPSTRRIAVAPMMYLAAQEQGAVFFDRLRVDYEPATIWKTSAVASDDFSSYGASNFGGNQPTGWSEFGGDWFAMPTEKWATLWNPRYAAGSLPAAGVDTGMVKTFSLSGLKAGDVINARVFAAATFSDKRSFVRLRLVFNGPTGPAVESDRQVRGYGLVDVRRQTIPAGATSVTVIVNAFLGAAETSSLYVDNLVLNTQRRN